MKKVFTVLILSLFCVNGVLAAKKFNPIMYSEAEAVIKVSPDSAVVSCSIVDNGSSPVELKNKIGKTAGNIIEYCKKAGIPEKNITVGFLSLAALSAESVKEEGSYNAEQEFIIVIENMQDYEKIMADLLALGINQINKVNLQVKDADNYKKQARMLATEKAKDKIKDLVDAAGLELVKIYSASETNQRYMPAAQKGESPNQYTDVYIDKAEKISYGSVLIKANVVISYEVK